jgi:hypothetical protein
MCRNYRTSRNQKQYINHESTKNRKNENKKRFRALQISYFRDEKSFFIKCKEITIKTLL